MMSVVAIVMLIGFLGSIRLALIGLASDRNGEVAAGFAGMIFFALQLGGALGG